MNCRECRRLIAVSLYGELPAGEKSALDAHVRCCPRCRAALEKTPIRLAEVFPEPAHPDAPDWEKSWGAVSARLEPRRSPWILPRRTWAPAGAVLLAVFIAGFLVGRRWWIKPPAGLPAETGAASMNADYDQTLQRFAENIQPLLLSYIHRSAAASPQDASPLERKIVQDMLVETRILLSLADRRGDPFLRDVIEDIETLLQEITRLRPGDGRLPARVLEWIEARSLPVKVRILAAPGPGI